MIKKTFFCVMILLACCTSSFAASVNKGTLYRGEEELCQVEDVKIHSSRLDRSGSFKIVPGEEGLETLVPGAYTLVMVTGQAGVIVISENPDTERYYFTIPGNFE